MATLVFSAVGTALGGPLGGVVGALVGRQVDSAVFGSGSVKGPRLKELDVTTSSYGSSIPRHYGRMRVAGSVIWATDLQESKEKSGGKNQPSVTTYSYSVSFAVALSSRRIAGIGRIWADGVLLRGAAGDLKTAGNLRIYTGEADQQPDPLCTQIEGPDRTPAYRGLAYAVFEDLDLSSFYNRLPALTFEVLCDEGVSLQDLIGDAIPDADAPGAIEGIDGMTCDGPLADALSQLEPFVELDADAAAPNLIIARARLQPGSIALSEPTVATQDGDFGGVSGVTRRRAPATERSPEILRYYDTDRDYLPGIQRATGRAAAGQPLTVDLPAALGATAARNLIASVQRRVDWSRDRLAWRTAELDPAVAPGSVVTLPDRAGRWRVEEWEWRESGIELALVRLAPSAAQRDPAGPVDPGRHIPLPDVPAPPTQLVAYERPWDGTGAGDLPAPFAAVSASGPTWSGAALFADHGDGALIPIGASGRTRSVTGFIVETLPAANTLLLDRTSTLIVHLAAGDLSLATASPRQLSLGRNLALAGSEIIQFARAEPLGDGLWQLSQLLRGRAGTESAVHTHEDGEAFVLLDDRPVRLDPTLVGSAQSTQIVAAGRGDPEPVTAPILLRGITVRPLSPVHPRVRSTDTGLSLSWTRRARGSWQWRDGVDAPLHEEQERYRIEFGSPGTVQATWETSAPVLEILRSELSDLLANAPDGTFRVIQRGSYALSEPLQFPPASIFNSL